MTYKDCIEFLVGQVQEIRENASNDFAAAPLIQGYFKKLTDDMVKGIEEEEAAAQAAEEADADEDVTNEEGDEFCAAMKAADDSEEQPETV